MEPIVAIVHATRTAIEPINEVFATHLVAAELLNFLDEAMVRLAWSKGVTSANVPSRMEGILVSAEKAGASLIVFSCTSFSPVIDRVCQSANPIPFLRGGLRRSLG